MPNDNCAARQHLLFEGGVGSFRGRSISRGAARAQLAQLSAIDYAADGERDSITQAC